jgi:uncharacterized protein YkwD
MGWLQWIINILKPAPAPVPPGPDPTPTPGPITTAAMVSAINQVRASHGLGGLVESPALSAQSLAHSREMAASGSLDHDGFAARIAAVFPNTAAGENVEENTFATAADCANQWMQDAAHQANMLGAWDTIGVGIAVDPRGQNWITADFDASR